MTAATTKEGSVEPTYDYHGGPPPPAADEKVVVTPSEEKDVKEAVIHETVAALEREEVQPVIERERIHTEIQQVVQPVLDVVNEAPVVESKELPEETHRYREKVKEDDVARYEAQAEAFCDETHQTQVVHEKVFKEPVIHEVVHTKIITEVQPVIERVVHKTHIVEETQPIKETFVKAPVVHEQEIAPPLTMEDFEKLQRNQKRSPSKSKSPTPAELLKAGPVTRSKRKRIAEATEGDTGPGEIVDDSLLNAEIIPAKPSVLHGTLEKIVGTVESGVGELLGSDSLVAKGTAKKIHAEHEIEAAQKKRRLEE